MFSTIELLMLIFACFIFVLFIIAVSAVVILWNQSARDNEFYKQFKKDHKSYDELITDLEENKFQKKEDES